jgi:hypothetical protein
MPGQALWGHLKPTRRNVWVCTLGYVPKKSWVVITWAGEPAASLFRASQLREAAHLAARRARGLRIGGNPRWCGA